MARPADRPAAAAAAPAPAPDSACALAARLARGEVSAEAVVEAALARVAARDPEIRAFAWCDPDHARRQARALDAWRRAGRPIGPLHGVPVGIKDIIDTARIPTENGTAVDAGRVPGTDATVVARLKAAGAVILGKTVTAEAAFLHPGPTRNPVCPDRTPGGSSQGSAAAVAAGMVPLAVGTQTGGSVIRPASYCGVVGYKPTFGLIPRTGILTQSPHLDTVGVFARDVADAALLADVLAGHDPGDPATAPAPAPHLLDHSLSDPPVSPHLARLDPPGWPGAAHPDLVAAMDELGAELSGLPVLTLDGCDDLAETRRRINAVEAAAAYAGLAARGGARLSPVLRDFLAEGRGVSAVQYLADLEARPRLLAILNALLGRFDALLTPAATGPAPPGLDSTGDALFNGLWTLAGVPAITLPVFQDSEGAPMGLQLIGRPGEDGRLLRTARWLERRLNALSEET